MTFVISTTQFMHRNEDGISRLHEASESKLCTHNTSTKVCVYIFCVVNIGIDIAVQSIPNCQSDIMIITGSNNM